MPDRDWYDEWLLGEVVRVWDRPMAVTFPFESLPAIYRDLTGHEPPPRPTEEEVRAWWRRAPGNYCAVNGVVEEAVRTLQRAAAADRVWRGLNPTRERMMARAVVEMPMGGGEHPLTSFYEARRRVVDAGDGDA